MRRHLNTKLTSLYPGNYFFSSFRKQFNYCFQVVSCCLSLCFNILVFKNGHLCFSDCRSARTPVLFSARGDINSELQLSDGTDHHHNAGEHWFTFSVPNSDRNSSLTRLNYAHYSHLNNILYDVNIRVRLNFFNLTLLVKGWKKMIISVMGSLIYQ